MAEFYTILTDAGRAKLTAAQAAGTHVQLTHMALGDGNGSYQTPNPAQTALVNEVYRAALNSVGIDAQNEFWLVCELVVPAGNGGFYIREVGLFDVDGTLIAIGKYPVTYKPTLADGIAKDLHIKMVFETANASSVQLSIDPSVVLASRDYVDGIVEQHAGVQATETAIGHIELATVAEAVAGIDTARAVTPAGLAAVAAGKVDLSAWAQKLHEPTGYQVFPGGLILQWGRTGIINSTAYATVTFPMTFPNAAWIVTGCTIGENAADAAGNNGGCTTYIIDQSRFTIGHYNAGSNNNAMFWIAVGN